MAEKRTINIDINSNASEAEKDFKSFNKAVDETTKSAKNLDATFEEVYGDLQPLTTRMGEAEDRLYELALAGDTASKEYQELLTKVGEYRKVQIETDLAVDGAATTMTQKLGSALNGVTSGFATTQGAMALFGGENEALEKSLLKVQGALAIQQGVDGLRTSYKELGGATGIATKAQKAFNFVMNLNPIILIVTGIVAATAAIMKFTSLLDPAIQGLKAFGDAIGLTNFKQKEAENAQIKRIEADRLRHKQAMANATKELAIIAQQVEAEKKRQKLLEDTYALELRKAKGNSQEIEQINKDLTQSKKDSIDEEERLFLESQQFKIKQEIAGIAEFQSIVDKNIARGRTDHQKELAEIARRQKTLSKLQSNFLSKNYAELQQFNVRRENLDIDYDEGVEQRRKEANDKYKSYLQDRLSIRRQIEDIENSLLEDGIEKELEINRDKFRKLREDAEKNTKLTTKERAALIDLRNKEEAQAESEIRNKFRQEELQKEIDFFENNKLPTLQDQSNKEVEIEFNKYATLGQIQKEAFEKEEALRKQKNEFALETTSQGLQTISNLTELFAGKNEKAAQRAFQIQKAVSIAQATIDTYKSANAIFASTAANPITIANPSAPFIAAGVAVAAGLVNVATIASQKFQGGGSSGGGGQESAPDLTGGATPQFNVVGDSGINQIAQLQQQPVQAFVVSGEVTTSQALDRNRVQNATL